MEKNLLIVSQKIKKKFTVSNSRYKHKMVNPHYGANVAFVAVASTVKYLGSTPLAVWNGMRRS